MKQLKLNRPPTEDGASRNHWERLSHCRLWSVLRQSYRDVWSAAGSCVPVLFSYTPPKGPWHSHLLHTRADTTCLTFRVNEDGHQEFFFPPPIYLQLWDTEISSIYQVIISTYAYKAVVQSKTHQLFPPSTDGISAIQFFWGLLSLSLFDVFSDWIPECLLSPKCEKSLWHESREFF